ncbi:hypothetical protein EJ06DRAFT_55120 [Trichodelitschia bisporula]|uniref:Uncharacterized protein n=1 Tax=Trichodelitschia bisporula TaxID=703511 RepID=A0A6G1HU39_9PEZI|nr:hypothetical protein EJ06DRAFT_55120 [Trichodelitschia bisporula]
MAILRQIGRASMSISLLSCSTLPGARPPDRLNKKVTWPWHGDGRPDDSPPSPLSLLGFSAQGLMHTFALAGPARAIPERCGSQTETGAHGWLCGLSMHALLQFQYACNCS